MSRIHLAYFAITSERLDVAPILQLNQSVGLRFVASSWSYDLTDNKSLGKKAQRVRDMNEFAREASDPSTFPICEWMGQDYSLSLGVLTDNSRRMVIIEISESSLERMELSLEDANLDVFWYICEVFRLLGSESMVMGPEMDYQEAREAFEKRPTENADIRVCVGALAAVLLATNKGFEAKTCGSQIMAVRWFPGYPS